MISQGMMSFRESLIVKLINLNLRKSQMKKFIKSVLFAGCLVFLPFASFAAPVDINSASSAEISKSLDGVGKAKADAIVAYRKAHGNFKSPQDLTKVKGISAKTVEKNKKNIKLGVGTSMPNTSLPPGS